LILPIIFLYLFRYFLRIVAFSNKKLSYCCDRLVQLLVAYTNPESHNAQRHRQTDRQTDDRMMPIADHTV